MDVKAVFESFLAMPHWRRIKLGLLTATAVLSGVVVPLLVIGRGAASILVPVIGGLVGVLLLSSQARLRRIWSRSALSSSVAVMLTILLISVAGSIMPSFSLTIWLQLAGLTVLIAALPPLLQENSALLIWTLRILLLASLTGATLAVISIYIWPPLLSYVRPVDAPTSYHAALRLKSYGAVMPCLLPVLLWAGWRLRTIWRLVAVLSILLGLVTVYGVHNRAALGGYTGALGAFLLVLGFRSIRRPFRIGILAAMAILVVAIVMWIIGNLPPMPFDPMRPMSLPSWLVDRHRQVIWGFVLDRAVEHPWFGWGLSTANFMPGANDPIPVIGQTFVPLHAHNWVLQIFSDAGGFGLVAVAITLFLFLRKLYIAAIARDAATGAALSLAGAFFVSTLANFSIWQGWWQSVFVILLSIALAGSRSPNEAIGAKNLPTQDGETFRSHAAVPTLRAPP